MTTKQIQQFVHTLKFAGLTPSQEKALGELITALEAAQGKVELPDDIPTVNIYGQAAWHFPARILADRAGLTAIRHAITAALDSGGKGEVEVSASDGEGYTLEIELAPDDFLFSADAPEPFYTDFPDMYESVEGGKRADAPKATDDQAAP